MYTVEGNKIYVDQGMGKDLFVVVYPTPSTKTAEENAQFICDWMNSL